MNHFDPTCPRCQDQNSRVMKTRKSLAGSVYRRRLCICGFRFETYEQVNTVPRFRALWVSLGFGRDVSS